MKYSLFILLLLPFSALATSGACSSHGGVNCSASDIDGSAICNDGWRNSSVKYYQMDECKPICSKPTSPHCGSLPESLIDEQYQRAISEAERYRVEQTKMTGSFEPVPGIEAAYQSMVQHADAVKTVQLLQSKMCNDAWKNYDQLETLYEGCFTRPSATPSPMLQQESVFLQKYKDCKSLVRNGTFNFGSDKCECVDGEKMYKVTNDVYDFVCIPTSSVSSPQPSTTPAPSPSITKTPKPAHTSTQKVVPTITVLVTPSTLSLLPSPSIYASVDLPTSKSFVSRFFGFFKKLLLK